MTIQTSFKIMTGSVLAVLTALLFVTAISVSAQEAIEPVTDTTQEESAPAEGTEAVSVETPAVVESFEYIAQSGDSYTLMARKAVQTSGFETGANLSEAQIIYVESNLTVLAGSPELNLGEKVTISKELVKQWSEKAKELTDAQQARWQVYANNANFNTNSVGEARE